MPARAPNDVAIQRELKRRHEKRLAAAIESLGSCNMNDTKWSEVFEILARRQPRCDLRIKFLYDERTWPLKHMYRMRPNVIDGAELGPFEFREIEWLEVTGESALEVREQLERLGKLPFGRLDNGFRLQAYGQIVQSSEN